MQVQAAIDVISLALDKDNDDDDLDYKPKKPLFKARELVVSRKDVLLLDVEKDTDGVVADDPVVDKPEGPLVGTAEGVAVGTDMPPALDKRDDDNNAQIDKPKEPVVEAPELAASGTGLLPTVNV